MTVLQDASARKRDTMGVFEDKRESNEDFFFRQRKRGLNNGTR